MTILAIDPGPTQSAYVLWDGNKVHGYGILPNRELATKMALSDPEEVPLLAIEMIACYGMAVGKEVFETCVWIGRFLESWWAEPQTVQIPRLDIKVHLCKSAKAKDANVRQALIDRFGAPGTKKAPGVLHGISSHCWAALAVGVCAYDRLATGHMDALPVAGAVIRIEKAGA